MRFRLQGGNAYHLVFFSKVPFLFVCNHRFVIDRNSHVCRHLQLRHNDIFSESGSH